MVNFSASKIAAAAILLLLFTHCKVRRRAISTPLNASAQVYQGLSEARIKELLTKSSGSWDNPETRMVWLTLASNYFNHVEVIRSTYKKLGGPQQTPNLSMRDNGYGSYYNGPILTKEQQELALQQAEMAGRMAAEQQRLMLADRSACNDFAIRNAELFQKMDAQKFDQQIRAATTEADIAGKQADTFLKRIEAEKKIIENEILKEYASAYNSYVKVFHEYTVAMSAAMKGVGKVSKQASILSNSILEYNKRIRKCVSEETQHQNQNFLKATKNVLLNDYSLIKLNREKEIKERVFAIQDLPSGRECLEMGLIQANLDEYNESLDSSAYALKHPVFRLVVNENPDSKSAAARTIAACPAVDPRNDTRSLAGLTKQVEGFTSQVE